MLVRVPKIIFNLLSMPYRSPYPEKTLLFPLMEFLIERKGTDSGTGIEATIDIPSTDFAALSASGILSDPDIVLLKKDLKILADEPTESDKNRKILKIENPEILEDFMVNYQAGNTIRLAYDSFEIAKFYKRIATRDQLRVRGYNVDTILGVLGEQATTGSASPTHPLPAGTHWANVVFEFMNETAVLVTSNISGFEPFNISAGEMRMGLNSGAGNVQWQLLRRLANNHGMVEVPRGDAAIRQRKLQLKNKLQATFGMTEDPFEETRSQGIYQIKIQFVGADMPRRRTVEGIPTAALQNRMIESEVAEMFTENARGGQEETDEPDDG